MKNGILNEIRLGPDSETWRRIDTLLYLPTNYDPAKKYPLICFWHGLGEGGPNLSNLYNQGLPAVYQKHITAGDIAKTDLDKFIFLAIQGGGQQPPSTPVFLDGLNYVKTIVSIDEGRVYATGLSAGGYGSKVAAAKYPNIFAACVTMSSYAALAIDDTDKDLMFWYIHGTNDPTCAFSFSENDVNRINAKFPGHAILTSFVGGHCCWPTYYEPSYRWVKNEGGKDIGAPNGLSIYEWLLQYRLDSVPAETGQSSQPEQSAQAFIQPNAIITGSTKEPGGTGNITITLPTNSITLDASKSTGSADEFKWGILGDSPNKNATISGQGTSRATFSNLTAGQYKFFVNVTSNSGGWPSSSLMNVTVQKSNTPPAAPTIKSVTVTYSDGTTATITSVQTVTVEMKDGTIKQMK